MKKLILTFFLILTLPTTMLIAQHRKADDKKLLDKVARWQIAHLDTTELPAAHWANAALYRGMAGCAKQSNARYLYDFLVKIGQDCRWDMMPRRYDADDLCIGQTYFMLYDKYKKPEMIARIRERVDSVMSAPKTNSLRLPNGKYNRERWGWCDALFMAPPVYAAIANLTGERKYLDFCAEEFRVTTDSLFDPADNLYYRDLRFTKDREPNGEKRFWGRGNGWVYAGLALMLESVPKEDPSYAYYLDLFKKMSPAVLRTQDAKGSWHAGLYDPASYPQPENSASGFFVYGLAWGVNQGILTGSVYREAALKGWDALKSYVDTDGKLGFVQPIGHAPCEITRDMTAPYGVGAFILAGTEIIKLK